MIALFFFQMMSLLVLAVPISLIVLFVLVVRLNRRIARLETLLVHERAGISGRDDTLSAPAEPAAPSKPAALTEPEAPVTEPPATEESEIREKVASVRQEAVSKRYEGWHSPVSRSDRTSAGPAGPTTPDFTGTVVAWLGQNWFYAVSALSLALAGLFAAQYAADRGLLAPSVRVALAALFGAALIAAGEAIRRRFGDDESVATAYLPSVFSGAGLVTLFGAVLTARILYGLIGAETALAGLVAIAALAVVLGWFYGPLLAAIGILGASVAPFLVGGEPGPPFWLYGYFGAVAMAGLLINILRKWRWIGGVSLFVPYGAAAIVLVSLGGAIPFIVLSVTLCLAAVVLSYGSLTPSGNGRALWIALLEKRLGDVPGHTRLIAAFWLSAVLGILLATSNGPEAVTIAAIAYATLFAASAIWSRGAPGLYDLPVLSACAVFVLAAIWWPPEWVLKDEALKLSVISTFVAIAGAAVIMSLLSIWRSAEEKGRYAEGWAVAAALIAPGMAVLLEILWMPARFVGTEVWAGIAMALAIVATIAARQAASTDGDKRHRVSLAALVAMSMVALSLFILLTKAALSVALAVLVLGAAVLDRRFRLPGLLIFIVLGVNVLAYRMIADPGLAWGMDAAWWNFLLAYAVPALAFGAARIVQTGMDRPLEKAVLESGLAIAVGVCLSLAIARWLESHSETAAIVSHWSLGLTATVWLIVGAMSFRSARLTARLTAAENMMAVLARRIRQGIGLIALTLAGLALLNASTVMNPLFNAGETIVGVVGFSSLALAYLLPGLVLIGLAWTAPGTALSIFRPAGTIAGGALAALYLCLSIAQAWRGNVLAGQPMGDGELWSYTVLMLIVGSLFLLAAIRLRSVRLRYAANIVLVAAIAKVFFIDATDLDGLVRAGSFLILGLALAGLAWVNRRASMARSQTP